jgi:hypothetical protein
MNLIEALVISIAAGLILRFYFDRKKKRETGKNGNNYLYLFPLFIALIVPS